MEKELGGGGGDVTEDLKALGIDLDGLDLEEEHENDPTIACKINSAKKELEEVPAGEKKKVRKETTPEKVDSISVETLPESGLEEITKIEEPPAGSCSTTPATTTTTEPIKKKDPKNDYKNLSKEQLMAKLDALKKDHEKIKQSLSKKDSEATTAESPAMRPKSETAPEATKTPETRTSEGSTSSTTKRRRKKAIKVIVVGNSKCGKTSIINRYVKDVFSNEYKYTIGCDYSMKEVQVTPDIRVRLQLWDIAGQDRFIHLSRAFYKKSAGAILVCDVTRPATMDALRSWKSEIDKDLIEEAKRRGTKVPIVMIANKVDLLSDTIKAIQTGSDVQTLAEELELDGWFMGSAKKNSQISEAMMFLLKKIVGVVDETEKHETMPTKEAPETPPKKQHVEDPSKRKTPGSTSSSSKKKRRSSFFNLNKKSSKVLDLDSDHMETSKKKLEKDKKTCVVS
eukprot:CAMPEP_0197526176 /NCGR_PEP_ID=MMETSP1318-20131121/16539_1 /TAXON_ID=552666 /ORGANISM="Partenskyella glossopodia, Strain RCC365" /LENGTH=453 /DNA_ID=CAMNT_0043080207 /DNA_START=12 /DNA_END=1373 /DNA_ORIENTATION=+